MLSLQSPKFDAGQIGHSVVNRSPPLRHFDRHSDAKMDPAYSLRVTARPIGRFSSRIEFALFGYNLLLVFPSGCSSYRGAKNLACLRRIWLEAGCAEEGFASPENMTQDQLLAMSSFNLRYLKYFSTSNNIVVIIAINDVSNKKQKQ